MRGYLVEKPLIVDRGEGSYLYDVEGNRYLDGTSSLWVNVHGHVREEINRAIREQLDRVAHSTLLGLANVPSVLLAKKLVEITPPGLNKVFYSDSGATSVEIALKIAYQYWQQQEREEYRARRKFISLTEAYHGDTIGSVSVGGMDLFHSKFKPLLFETIHAPAPYCYRCPLGKNKDNCSMDCLKEVENILDRHHREVAAFLIEPLVQGAAGMVVAPEGYLAAVSKLCKRYNILLIADEVAVGFGRTGKMFACDHEGVRPDLMCLAKGITGGYLPLAATLATDVIFDAFMGEIEDFKTFYHGHTYTGNPLACSAALANLDLMEKTDFIGGLQEKTAFLANGLKRFLNLEHVGDIRHLGMMAGIELVEDRTGKSPYPPGANIGHRVILEARKKGLIIRPLGNIIVLMPVLSMSLPQLEELLSITFDAIQTVTERTDLT
ncbi:MAG TPA: adenosylmethionine--8-amino-7-oxononanoate transaminase [Desulfotomaculum sp.]|nr:adenosylmethionine--8-amino-7-oxononanoate transaminase [Desulfotomaculum sp.]